MKIKNVKLKRNFFATIAAASLMIFATILGGGWLNFATTSSDFAGAVSADTYTAQQIEYIRFDDGPYIDTGFDGTGNTKVILDISIDSMRGVDPMNYRRIFGVAGTIDGKLQDGQNFMLRSYPWNNYTPGYLIYYMYDMGTSRGDFDDSRLTVEMDNGQLETNYPNDGYSQANIAGEITNQNHLWIGDVNDNNAVPTWGTGALRGQIYGAKIYKDDQLVLNLVPAARYICDQPDSVEYGFANDLDNDGNLANDEWFGNSGTGVLTGSEEVVVSACPVNPDDAENLDSNNSTGQVILPPNTAIFAR